MENLYILWEQLRDIIDGRETYCDDHDWAENIYAQEELVDAEIERLMSQDEDEKITTEETIAAAIFDFEYEKEDDRPSEEECHNIARKIICTN